METTCWELLRGFKIGRTCGDRCVAQYGRSVSDTVEDAS